MRLNSIEELEEYRQRLNYNSVQETSGNSRLHCLNTFRLFSARMLEFPVSAFRTLEQILLFHHIASGRIDYPFVPRKPIASPVYLRVYLPTIDESYLIFPIGPLTTIGSILDELAIRFQLPSTLDYDLFVSCGDGRGWLLDRD
jgi:hypothetical protein